VHDFDGGGQLRDADGGGPVERLVRREDQRRTQALPFAEQTVADDFVARGRPANTLSTRERASAR